MQFPPVLCHRYLSTRLFLSFLTFSLPLIPLSLCLLVLLFLRSSAHLGACRGCLSMNNAEEVVPALLSHHLSLSLSLCQCILSISHSPCPHFSSKTIIPLRRSGMWFPVCLFFCKKKCLQFKNKSRPALSPLSLSLLQWILWTVAEVLACVSRAETLRISG